MPTPTANRRKVLFVDDEQGYLDIIQRVLGQYSQKQWEIFTALNTSKALALLQEHSLNLIVIDAHMPVVDGLQFLKILHRKYPDIPKAVLTGFADDNYRSACLSSGAELFLEKPRCVDGMEIVFAALDELSRWQPEAGFRGVLRRVGLQDVLQMECLGRSSSVLEITAGETQGRVYIKDGSIIHANVGERKGEDAFNHLLALSGGEFNLKQFTEPPERTIEGQWEFLLMEAARMRDESGQRTTGTAPTTTELPGREALNLMTTVPGLAGIPDLITATPRAAAPASSETALLPQEAVVLHVPETSLGSTTFFNSMPPRIDEMLVCSAQGDVLYEWQCADVATRINLMEFVSQKARQLAQGLPLGTLDRLEMQSQNSRLVSQFQAEHGVFVRSSRATVAVTQKDK